MTDTVEPGTTEEQAAKVAEMKPAEASAPIERDCACQTFELVGKDDPDEVFKTDCGRTTKSVFAQGHDARLVSFLVDGYMDGYALRRVVNSTASSYATPADAAGTVSEALRNKAATATVNAQAKAAAKAAKAKERADAKQAKQAEKAKAAADKAAKKAEKAGPKATGAEVVAGSAEGDTTPLADGQTKIKVGRWEYNATIDEDGNATYTDGSGEEHVIERDGYRVLA